MKKKKKRREKWNRSLHEATKTIGQNWRFKSSNLNVKRISPLVEIRCSESLANKFLNARDPREHVTRKQVYTLLRTRGTHHLATQSTVILARDLSDPRARSSRCFRPAVLLNSRNHRWNFVGTSERSFEEEKEKKKIKIRGINWNDEKRHLIIIYWIYKESL